MWNWEFALDILPELFRGLAVTLEAVILGMFMALVTGLAWAVLRRSHVKIISWPAGFIVEFVRSTPLLIQLFFVFYSLPLIGITLSPMVTGVLTLGLHYSCYTAEVYRAGIEGIPRGQWEASKALGLTRYETYRHVVLPQAIPPVIPALGNYLIAMFKDTPVLSAITVLEVLQRAMIIGKESFRFLEPLTLVGVMYLALSLLSGMLVHHMEIRLKLER